MRCKLCVPIRNQASAGQSGVRRVSKALALGIWEEGQPNHSWVVFESLVCIRCRRFFEKKYLNDAMRRKSDELFGKCVVTSVRWFNSFHSTDWLYDCHVVHTPTVISRTSEGQPFDFVNEESNFQQGNSRKRALDEALRGTGFTDRIWMTSSFHTLKPQSRINFLCQMENIIQHVLTIYAPIDHEEVHVALIARQVKKEKKKIESKLG
jgi:hypothetical protein